MKEIAERLKAAAPEGIEIVTVDGVGLVAKVCDKSATPLGVSVNLYDRTPYKDIDNAEFIVWAIGWMRGRHFQVSEFDPDNGTPPEYEKLIFALGQPWLLLTTENVATTLAEVWEALKVEACEP